MKLNGWSTRQYISTPVNCSFVGMVVGKQPCMVPFLHHNKSYGRLIIWLQVVASLKKKEQEHLKKETDKMHSKKRSLDRVR